MLSADDVRLLDRLTLDAAPRAASASPAGARLSRQRAFGVEFHEYRHYQPGDDPRSIDWNVEARLRQLMVRVSRAQGHVPLHVLVDTSASMSIGAPAKLACARKVAAALCYIALARRDAAGLATFDDRIRSHVRPASGREQLFRLLDMLERTTASGPSSVDEALISYAASARGPGLVVVISDFFGTTPRQPGLRALLHRGLTLSVVQMVAPEDERPQLNDDVELVDAEDPAAAPLVADASMLARYRERLAAHADGLRDVCLHTGQPWVRLNSGGSFQELVSALERAGLFRT